MRIQLVETCSDKVAVHKTPTCDMNRFYRCERTVREHQVAGAVYKGLDIYLLPQPSELLELLQRETHIHVPNHKKQRLVPKNFVYV
jgi:hypothetical protein